MKIMIDILHPAHVHVYKNFIEEMEKRGHEITVTAREKDVAIDLLNHYNIPYTKLSSIADKKLGLFRELWNRSRKFARIAKVQKPDLLLGCMGATIAPVGFLKKIPSIVIYNNESLGMFNKLAQTLASRYVTGECWEGSVWGQHVKHPSYHELAYLHPNRFSPDPSVLDDAGISGKDTYFVVRFTSWQSIHDIGAKGFGNREKFLQEIEKHGKVFVTSEKPLPKEIKKYEISIPFQKIHSFLNYAAMSIGESATIAAESAVLGTPAIYIANTMRGYTNELERKYGLCHNFSNQEEGLSKALELLETGNFKKEYARRRKNMLKERIDLTGWLVDYVDGEKWR